jgi:transposase-like protein
MDLMTQSLNCPNCAAPLRVREQQTVALCVYCGSSIKLDAGGAAPQSIEQRDLTPEVLSQVNQLLLDGRRAEAMALYQQQAGVTDAEAREAIDNLATQLTRRTLLRQPISNLGIGMFVVFTIIGLGALAWGLTNSSWLIMLLGAGWLAWHWLVFLPATIVRWRYETGQAAPARIQKMIRLGDITVRGQPVSAVRLWVEVHPVGQPTFQMERNVILHRESLEKLSAGSWLEVRCQPDRREAIPTTPLKIIEARI